MSATPSDPRAGATSQAEVPVRLAAALVLICGDGDTLRVLTGRRSAQAVFMPSRLVFPGGGVEPQDAVNADAMAALGPAEICPDHEELLGLVSAETAIALPQAARRELWEETGVQAPKDGLSLVCRAITPPGQVRRYDTWFFLASVDAPPPAPRSGDGELTDIAWRRTADLDQAHPITQAVWAAAMTRMRAPNTAPPFLRSEDGRFVSTPLWD